MKLDLLVDKTKEEIASIWTRQFASKDAVCAVIPVDTFKQMKELYTIHKTVSCYLALLKSINVVIPFHCYSSYCRCQGKKAMNLS